MSTSDLPLLLVYRPANTLTGLVAALIADLEKKNSRSDELIQEAQCGLDQAGGIDEGLEAEIDVERKWKGSRKGVISALRLASEDPNRWWELRTRWGHSIYARGPPSRIDQQFALIQKEHGEVISVKPASHRVSFYV